jgi:hypothetical protein
VKTLNGEKRGWFLTRVEANARNIGLFRELARAFINRVASDVVAAWFISTGMGSGARAVMRPSGYTQSGGILQGLSTMSSQALMFRNHKQNSEQPVIWIQ